MPAANYLPDVLETTEAERLATGFVFTEGPLWHPEGYWYFVDIRQNKLFRLTPGKEPEVVRNTIGGNGTTFDLQGRLVVCEGDDRRLTRMDADGKVESLVDDYRGGRFNRPNDVICHSNGCLYFTDPDKRRPYHEREIVAIHPRDQARCGRQHGWAKHLCRYERGRGAGHTRWLEGRQHWPGVLHRGGRHLGNDTRRQARGHHQVAGASREF